MCIKRKISNIEKFWKAILSKENVEKYGFKVDYEIKDKKFYITFITSIPYIAKSVKIFLSKKWIFPQNIL